MTIEQVKKVIKKEFVREGVGSLYIDPKLNMYMWKDWKPSRAIYTPNGKSSRLLIFLL